MRLFFAVMIIFALVAVPVFSGEDKKENKDANENAPECLKGFAGMLHGKLVKKLDVGFMFEIKEVKKTWEHNKSEGYKKSVGKKIRVYYRKNKTDKGKMVVAENLVNYIKKQEIGAEFVIDVREDGNKIYFLELTKEQREFLKKDSPKKEEPKEMKPELPDGMIGFSGMLKGKIVSKQKNGFVLKVEKIEKLWKGNKAKNAESVVGKKVLINVNWEEHEKGKWRPKSLEVKFVDKLKVGSELSIEVHNVEGERLHILELSKEQRELAEKKEESKEKKDNKKEEVDWKKEYEIPEGMIGFSGVLEGKVVKKVDKGFVLEVTGVPQVWKDSKAKNTASVIGKKVLIFVGWQKNDKGKWHPIEKHLKYVKELKVEQKIKIEAKNHEGRHLGILELGD